MHEINAEYRDQKEIRLALDANWDNDKQPLLVFERLRQQDLRKQGKLGGNSTHAPDLELIPPLIRSNV